MINWFRRLLINAGKSFPFILCFVLFVGYAEIIIRLILCLNQTYGATSVVCSNFSLFIGGYFEYNYLTIVAMIILSISFETCYWNKLAVLYLLLHLIFKNYVQDVVFDETEVYIVSIVNAAISFFLSYKGAEILVKHG